MGQREGQREPASARAISVRVRAGGLLRVAGFRVRVTQQHIVNGQLTITLDADCYDNSGSTGSFIEGSTSGAAGRAPLARASALGACAAVGLFMQPGLARTLGVGATAALAMRGVGPTLGWQ